MKVRVHQFAEYPENFDGHFMQGALHAGEPVAGGSEWAQSGLGFAGEDASCWQYSNELRSAAYLL